LSQYKVEFIVNYTQQS